MFENSWYWTEGMCDICGRGRFHDLALEIVEPGVMDKNGHWIDGYSKEKSQKWGAALTEATKQLTVRCLRIDTTDGDSNLVCKNCIQQWLKEGETNES
jgi:allantoicase